MQRRTDRRVLADVKAALEAAPVDHLAITATIADGVVQLSGELASHSERLEAMTVARDAEAPARVVSALTVAPVGRHYRLTDEDMAVAVARALVEAGVDPSVVRFTVTDRVVTLTGTVATQAERARIRHLVQAADGVHFIDNRIVVAAAPATHP